MDAYNTRDRFLALNGAENITVKSLGPISRVSLTIVSRLLKRRFYSGVRQWQR